MADQLVSIPRSHVHHLDSDSVGRGFQIWVAEPVAGVMPLPPGPRQVLYVLDADLFFGTAVETSRLMAQLFGELPPLLVVGIAYGTSPVVQSQLRTRDFTPSDEPSFARMASAMPGVEPVLPEGERMGGADRFLAFVRQQLQPFVAAHYDVQHTGSAVFGSSLGGLFAAYTLLQAPDTFDRYLIASPGLWWNGGEVMKLIDTMAPPKRDLQVYLAAGSREEDPAIPMLASYRLVSNTVELGRRLKSRSLSQLAVSTDILDGETHTSTVPVSMARGLRTLFGRSR